MRVSIKTEDHLYFWFEYEDRGIRRQSVKYADMERWNLTMLQMIQNGYVITKIWAE